VSDRRLYLIRHARPDYDSTDHTDTPLGRQYDPPLGEVGLEQAERLASRLELLARPAAIYSSTLARASQTAHVYADRIGMAVIERADLCEWFGGEWEAKDFEQIFTEHPEAIDLFRNQNPAWHLAPGSERADHFQRRCVAAVESIIDDEPEGDVVVVAHGGVINAYFSHILGIKDQDMFFLPENTSLNTVVIRGTKRLAWFLSDASHLTDPGWFEPREHERHLAEGR
jgi:broad specificity phosphatase PhoE